MATAPSEGKTFGYAAETALGTNGGTFSEIRYNEEVTYPSNTRVGIANPNKGHGHPFDFSDKPIFIQKYRENALAFQTMIRRSASANTAPPIALFFESAGCDISTTTVSSVATYVDESNFDLGDSGAAYGIVGDIILPRINDGTSDLDNFYYPALIAAKATDTIDLAMELPAATANAEPIEVMTTIQPRSQAVSSTKTLAFRRQSRATHTTAEDLTDDLEGCALGGVAEMTLTPSSPVTMDLTFHIGKVDQKNVTFAAETFVDSEKFVVINDNFRFEFAADAVAGNIARADSLCKEAKISWGFKTVPIPSEGDGTFAGIQGYMAQSDGPARVTITAEFSKSHWTDMEASELPSYYIGLVQPTDNLATPAMAFFAPMAHLDPDTPPVVDYSGDSYILATVTYICSSAGYDSDTLPADPGAAPWYFGISGAST